MLQRAILDHPYYTDANTIRLLIHLLLRANHSDGQWHGITVKRGQILTGTVTLATELKLTRQMIRTAIKHLESSGDITSEKVRVGRSEVSLFTMVSYDFYASGNNDQTSEQPVNNQSITTNNKDNKYHPVDDEKIIQWKFSFGFDDEMAEVVKTCIERYGEAIAFRCLNDCFDHAAMKPSYFYKVMEGHQGIPDNVYRILREIYPNESKTKLGEVYDKLHGIGGNDEKHVEFLVKCQQKCDDPLDVIEKYLEAQNNGHQRN